MRLFVLCLFFLPLLIISCESRTDLPARQESAGQDSDAGLAEQAAVEVARTWLSLVDTGKFDQSWETSAEIFRRAVTSEGWRGQMDLHRVPLGKLLSREVSSAKYMTSLPGAPDGQYVVITFNASFENKMKAIETVTPMKDSDGEWRVSGYYIR